MNKALKELAKTDSRFSKDIVVHNYNYVRIEAQMEETQLAIEDRKDIDLFNYPLDYKIKKTGMKFTENGKKTPFQVYWAATPTNYKFPEGLDITVLEKLYLPFGNGKEDLKIKESEKSILEILEEKSLVLTNNSDKSNKNAKISNNTPSGTVTVYDQDLMKFLPIEGVNIRAKRWFTTRYAVTNSSGYYSMSYSFNGQVDYDILWEASEFDIRSGSYGQASTGQNNINGSWSPIILPNVSVGPIVYPSGNLIVSNISFGYAHAFRGAFVYYYKNSNWGIKTPPKYNGNIVLPGFNTKIKIGVNISSLISPHYFDGYGIGFLASQVRVTFEPSSSSEIKGRFIFGTTVHELAHASHWELGFTNNDYVFSNERKRFAEAWAVGVEYKITNDVYQNLSFNPPFLNNYVYDYGDFQNSPLADIPGNTYFPLFVDLMDNVNQLITNGAGLPNDQVSGFSLSRLEQNLANNYNNWDGMRNTCVLIQNFGVVGGTQQNINYIFDQYK